MMQVRGLTKKEAESLLQKYGSNEIREVALSSPAKILLRQIMPIKINK